MKTEFTFKDIYVDKTKIVRVINNFVKIGDDKINYIEFSWNGKDGGAHALFSFNLGKNSGYFEIEECLNYSGNIIKTNNPSLTKSLSVYHSKSEKCRYSYIWGVKGAKKPFVTKENVAEAILNHVHYFLTESNKRGACLKPKCFIEFVLVNK